MLTVSRIILYIVTIAGAGGLIWCVTEARRSITYVVPIGLAVFGISFVAALFAAMYIHDENIYYSAIATISLVTLVPVMLYISKDPWYKLLFELATQANAFLITMYVGKSFGVLFGNNEWADVGFRALSFIIIILMYKTFLKDRFRSFANQYNSVYGWLFLFIVTISFTVLFLSIQYFPVTLAQRTDVKLFTTVMNFAIVAYTITYIALVALFNRILLSQKAKAEVQAAELKMDYWKAQIATQEVLINNTRKIKHDMRHHDALLVDCITNKEYDKALKYLQEHGAITDQITIKQYCENYTVNCLLSTYIRKAENAGIQVECQTQVPKELQIDDLRLASIFANLVENAIEACDRIKDESVHKFINISSKYDNGALKILVENSSNDDVKFDGPFPISQKANPSGIGTKTIYEFANRYNGLCEYTLENGVFSARLLLVV